MAARDCIAAIRAAGKGLLDDQHVEELVERVQRHIERTRAEGRAARAAVDIAAAVQRDAEALRLEGALARKHAALTVLAQQRVADQVAVFRAAGLDPRKAVLAVLEGTARGIPGARASVAQAVGAYRGDYLGSMFARLDALGPRVLAAMREQGFQDAVVREMRALGRGGAVQGAPVTGNVTAQQVAQILAETADRARRDLNRLGGMVGELEGWSPQAHDRARIARAGPDAWIAFILPRLDLARSFPDAAGDARAVRGILAEMFDSITANVDRVAPERDQALAASRVTPTPNLARALGRHRVLHFADASAWLQYREQFGTGHVLDAMIGHLERAARIAGQMEVLGPNPAYTLQTTLDRLRRQIREDAAIPPPRKAALARALTLGGRGGIASAYAEMQGLTFGVGGSETVAAIGSELRAWQGVAKLAGAFISSFFSDPVVQANNLRFLGRGWGDAIASQVLDFLRAAPDREAKRLAFKLGVGFDTLASRITTSYFVHDGQPGLMQRLLNWTMRWQGLSWFTDHLRGTGARLMAEDLAEAATAFRKGGWDAVDAPLRHALTLHGIGPREWAVMARARVTLEGGRQVLTPDAVGELADAAIAPALGERLARAERAAAQRARALWRDQHGVTLDAATPAQRAEADRAGQAAAAATRARLIAAERRRLQVALMGFFYDEARAFQVIEPNAQVRRWMLDGTQRGTFAGETLRFMAAFKSYPVGFTSGPLARAVHGGPAQRAAGVGNIAMLIAGLTVAGYAAMTAKDFVRGYGPRDPTRPATILAALLQGGGLGIYGDFLFDQASRFGGSTLATMAGPVIAEGASLIDLAKRARDGDVSAAEALNWFLRNSPFINLWWARAGLDYLILNELRDAATPGWLARQQRRRAEDYGQAPLPWSDRRLDVF